MSDGKLRSKPPGGGSVDDFISGAGSLTQPETGSAIQPERPETTETLPWEAPGIREDVTKVYNLRLPEAYLLKLRYIAEHTPDSMQQFCLNVLLPVIDSKIRELTSRPNSG
jgi:hypothetical protein